MTIEVAEEYEAEARENAVAPKSAEDFLRIVKGFGCECFLLGMPDGVEYVITCEEGGDRIEVYDPAERDDYRHETFDTVEAALSGFIVDGTPLRDYWAKVKVAEIIRDC